VGWLAKLPVVSLSIAVATCLVHLGESGELRRSGEPDPSSLRFTSARAEARTYLRRNPELVVDPLGERILDSRWLEATRRSARASEDDLVVDLPASLEARAQARLDRLIDVAYEARLATDPAWRWGVLDLRSPPRSYLAHGFFHETQAGLILTLAILLLAGAPLERAWGSLLFGGFVLLALPGTALIDRLLEGASGIPWTGGAGLAGAVLGAHFIRGLGGHFLLPGWLLLPVWLGIEAFGVRGFWLDDLDGVPWTSLIAAIGLGALAAGALRLLGVEARLFALSEADRSRGPNPVVARAARLRSDGDPYQAFDLIQAAWRDDPSDTEVAEAFFAIAVEVGQPTAAAEAIRPSLDRALRRGDMPCALEYWLPLACAESELALEATAAVRLGEGLLDAGHPEAALFSLRRALEAEVSSGHATRIVHVARDLDDGLARRAARIALADPSLDPANRADLELIVARVDERDQPAQEAAVETREPEPSRSQLDRRIRAEHHAIETTAFPIDSDVDLPEAPSEPLSADLPGDPSAEIEAGEIDSHEASLVAQALDPSAISPESLESAIGSPEVDEAAPERGSFDSLSHWNDPGRLDDLGEDLELDLPSDSMLISSDDLESIGADLELTRSPREVALDPREAETDSDMTPMMGLDGELSRRSPDPDGTTQTVDRPLRALKALAAVPIASGQGWIEIDVDERGKSRLPLSRVEAIGMAAVSGLATRPVLIVDFVLNWSEDPEEPLKVIRLRSDRFDPQRFEPEGGSPLEALRVWVGRLRSASGAACLPSSEMLAGRFVRFDSVGSYDREVLQARSPR